MATYEVEFTVKQGIEIDCERGEVLDAINGVLRDYGIDPENCTLLSVKELHNVAGG